MTNTTAAPAPIINGRTAAEWEALAVDFEAKARRSSEASRESFERCDTDGYLSQWASDSMAREYHAGAAWARDHGFTTITVLLLLDGTLASTHERDGQYGSYWILNDEAVAALRLSKPFLNLSKAATWTKRAAANARKGVKLGRARVPANKPKLSGSGYVLSAWAEPQWSRVKAGEIEIVDADWQATLQAADDRRAEQDAAREAEAAAKGEPSF